MNSPLVARLLVQADVEHGATKKGGETSGQTETWKRQHRVPQTLFLSLRKPCTYDGHFVAVAFGIFVFQAAAKSAAAMLMTAGGQGWLAKLAQREFVFRHCV